MSPRRVDVQYTVIIEKGPASYGAYIPDLPGCVAVADTYEETETLIREAVEKRTWRPEPLPLRQLQPPMPQGRARPSDTYPSAREAYLGGEADYSGSNTTLPEAASNVHRHRLRMSRPSSDGN